jgi:hypothetical protein
VHEGDDAVSSYGKALGYDLRPRTILVEGITDVDLFTLAATSEKSVSGIDLFDGLAIITPGLGDAGGTQGVIRELVAFRGIARTVLQANGLPKYRFAALFDNDAAGKRAVNNLRGVDHSIIECKDVFRLRPVMPTSTNLDPTSLCKMLETHNANHLGLDWEMEDLIPTDVVDAFVAERPNSIIKPIEIGGHVHREFTRDGKAQLHRFVKDHCVHQDLRSVIDVLRALRSYLGLK